MKNLRKRRSFVVVFLSSSWYIPGRYLCYVTATRHLAVCRALHEEHKEETVEDTRCGSSELDELWTGESALFVGVI